MPHTVFTVADLTYRYQQQSISFGDTPKKKGKGKSKSNVLSSDEDVYLGSPIPSEGGTSTSSASNGLVQDLSELTAKSLARKKRSGYVDDVSRTSPLSQILNRRGLSLKGGDACGLCGLSHPEAACFMTESSENLAQYRNILLTHAGDEALDDRVSLFVAYTTLAIDVVPASSHRSHRRNVVQTRPYTSRIRSATPSSRASASLPYCGIANGAPNCAKYS